MPNIPKTELDAAPYIVYTGKPDVVYDGSGGGGGGIAIFDLVWDDVSERYISTFSFNQILTAVEAGKAVYARLTTEGEGIHGEFLYSLFTIAQEEVEGDGNTYTVEFSNDYAFSSTNADEIML